MQDFIRLDHPPFFPQQCVACASQKGVFVDTRRDLPGDNWRVYICDSCMRRGAILFGWIEGDEQDRLMDAARLLAIADKRVAELEAGTAAAGQKWHDEKDRADRLQQQLDEALNRERTRVHQLEELTRQAAELVA